MNTKEWECQTCGAYFRSPVYKRECFRCGGDQDEEVSPAEWVMLVALISIFAIQLWVMGCSKPPEHPMGMMPSASRNAAGWLTITPPETPPPR